jgi:hypothetical protein
MLVSYNLQHTIYNQEYENHLHRKKLRQSHSGTPK